MSDSAARVAVKAVFSSPRPAWLTSWLTFVVKRHMDGHVVVKSALAIVRDACGDRSGGTRLAHIKALFADRIVGVNADALRDEIADARCTLSELLAKGIHLAQDAGESRPRQIDARDPISRSVTPVRGASRSSRIITCGFCRELLGVPHRKGKLPKADGHTADTCDRVINPTNAAVTVHLALRTFPHATHSRVSAPPRVGSLEAIIRCEDDMLEDVRVLAREMKPYCDDSNAGRLGYAVLRELQTVQPAKVRAMAVFKMITVLHRMDRAPAGQSVELTRDDAVRHLRDVESRIGIGYRQLKGK
ncbi:hypothetical protein H9P43_006805 [Blastocladiella emersonii ATCC 22665]|nr:hypothetical protein H9P43_006805 [Blastocladiella emersonii ATCC 22665]